MSAPKIEVPTVSDITDAARDFVAGSVSTVSNGFNNMAQQASDGVRDGIAGTAQNVERNTGRILRDAGRALQGDFTGFDRTLVDLATFGIGGLFTNPDEVTTVTGMATGEEQLQDRARQDAANQAAAALAAEEQDRLNAIKDVLTGQAAARQRTPGRASVLSLGGGDNYTLLTGF